MGSAPVFAETALDIEPEPFAAGAYGVISRARLNQLTEKEQANSPQTQERPRMSATTLVVVKELNPQRASEFLSKHNATVAAPKPAAVDDEGAGALLQGFADFQHEATLMSSLQHPNIVRLYGIMLNPLCLVMEFCAEGDLRTLLERQRLWGGPVPADAREMPPLCMKIAQDVARGMRLLHAQSPPIAHRDLRSPNIFLVSLDPSSVVCAKVADFGLSVAVTSRQTLALSSWQWMSPEAQLGKSYSHLCDLYSYAMVVSELFTQRVPFSEYDSMPLPTLQRGTCQSEACVACL